MSLPDDALRKILVQIQNTAVQSQRALNLTGQQANAKERERRILQLTIDEIGAIEGDVNLYKGVGKMFMMVPRKEMEKELKGQEKELSDDIASLAKKSKYLEKQFSDAQAQLRDIKSYPTMKQQKEHIRQWKLKNPDLNPGSDAYVKGLEETMVADWYKTLNPAQIDAVRNHLIEKATAIAATANDEERYCA
ncbi:Prefoldin [Roridomyces roridus]|uniref:Prefoldin n=1 Tax=Roridomyces roridus TaxID=1738132 RepID=A0AAD7B609_9AGAR|nr:Prefoldin [Roridomyces roridus]